MFYREASRAVFWRVDNARWYDTSLGRFTQADSIIPAGVQGYDRYAAMNNNPVRYTDPSGHSVACEDLTDCGVSGGDGNPSPKPRDTPNNSMDEPEKDATSSLGEVLGGSKGPGLNSPVSAKNCEGVSGFSYCKYLDDTYIVLEWNGQHVQVNLAYLDLANVEDLKIFLAVQAYTDAADSFEGNMSTLPYDLLIFGVGAGGGIAGAASCIQTAGAGCGFAIPSSIIAYAEAKNLEKKFENIVSARDTGEEKFLFLLDNASDMFK